MRYPWANVLLLLLMALELVTGYLGLTSGTPQWVAALHLHRIGGFAIVALLLWKGRNILPPLTRLRRWRRLLVPHLASLLLFALLLSSLALGMAWSHTGPYYFMGFSGVSWHIYLAVAMIPIVLWHTIFHRSTLRPQFWAERRSFLRLGGLLVAGLVLWRAGELGTKVLGLAGSQRRFTGSYTASSFSGNNFPETSWINDNPQPVDEKTWRLKVTGRVERELEIPYEDVTRHHTKVTATLDCTGGWYTEQEWEGVPLGEVLEAAASMEDAASVTVRSVTGYYRRFSLKEARSYLLASRVGEERLSHSHGFPLRLVASGKRGFEWVKLVTALEVNDTSKWWQPPLPLQ